MTGANETLNAAFATRLEQLAPAPSLRAARNHAFARFAAQGLPTTKDEAWHYTRLDPAQTTELEFSTSTDSAEIAKIVAIPDLGPPQLVFQGGRVHSNPTGAMADHIGTLADIWAQRKPGDLADERPRGALVELNRALAIDGGVIRLPANFKTAAPLYVVFDAASGQSQNRLSLSLEAGAQLDLILHHAGNAKGWNNLVIDIEQADGSRLNLYRLNELGSDYRQTEVVNANLSAKSRLNLVSADLGGQLCRNEWRIRFAGEGARAQLDGLFVANEDQHIDNHLLLDHAASNTISGQRFRGIGNYRGRGIFNGKVVVREGTQGVDAQQSSNNLLLAERCEIDTKPELEIYADDVKCSHGATVGELDEDQLYYLRTRGIDAEEARRLLIEAFAVTVVERFSNPHLAAQVTAALNRQLNVGRN